METNEEPDVIISVGHSGNLNLDKGAAVENSNAVGDLKLNVAEKINNITNEKNKENDEDQDSVIIEEEVNNIIDLNEETDEEIELEIIENTVGLPNSTNNSPAKATEFVIVNAANLTSSANVVAESSVEDIQIKDELSEAITADVNTNDVLENDPMDLLELNHRSDCSSSIRSQEETDYADDGSSIGSSSIQTGSTPSLIVLDWIKDYPWLLYEEGDDQVGYCLYCDAKINHKSQRSVKQHGISLYHKERWENYLAFREEEDKNGLGMKLVEIKEEFGTDSRVEALKLKRRSQSAALNNFNWRRWLEDCAWLERDSPEGSIGFCKYCLIHVNVEFSYLRERHQESTKHKEAEKQYELSNDPQRPIKTAIPSENHDFIADNGSSKNSRWLEVSEKEPAMARCKICGSKMFKNNFVRHLGTKLHENNEKIYLENEKAEKQNEVDDDPSRAQQNWKVFTKLHPWMTSDPENPTFAYCKYCEKRIVYGTSASKRATHEHSLQHKHNEIEFKKRLRNHKTDKKQIGSNTQEDNGQNNDENQAEEKNEEEEEVDDDEEEDKNQNEENVASNEEDGNDEEENESDSEGKDNEDEDEEMDKEAEDDKESESENESKKRPKIFTDEWLNQYSWCKKYKKDPKNFIFCIYCRKHFRPTSRGKHRNTSMHRSAEKEFLSRQSKKLKMEDKKPSTENAPFFEWAMPLKNNPSSYSCIYCRVRISKNYSKKQHASSKIHQINESIYKNNRRKSSRNEENNTESSQPTPKPSTPQPNIATTKKDFGKVVIKAPSTVTLIKQLQKKYPWLSYKRSELRNHYGHCKICDSSLYIRSPKHIVRHVRSGRHIRILKAKKMQKVEKAENNEGTEVTEKVINKKELQTSPETTTEKEAPIPNDLESQKAFSYKSTIAEMKKRFSWIEKSEKTNYVYCRFCNSNIPLKIIFLRNHSNSPKHRHYVIKSYSVDGGKMSKGKCIQNHADVGNEGSKSGDETDVLIVEDNNEEILISEQDENWTIKSETMDEHEELDYLLQRSFNNSSNTQRTVRKSANTGDGPLTKRVKRSQSYRRLNDSNSSLVASLLATPLTLASCLGPLIQQQLQQVNLSQAQNNSSATITSETAKSSTSLIESENTYDLFFKSVSETMKKLPVDLAAEGKLRVMQVLCDLELQALKRGQSPRVETGSSNISERLIYQSTSAPPIINTGSNTCNMNDTNAEQNENANETIITQFNVNTENSPPTSNSFLNPKVLNPNTVEKPTTSSPIIGVMDNNGLQTLQLKATAAKPIPRNATAANSGIRCIPFKNLSQPVTPDSSNQKIARIQVPITVPAQVANQNSKNLINFRNIQITKRIGTPANSVTPTTVSQQTVQKTTSISNKTYISNIQPQLQRWGSSVNGSTSYQTPTSTTVNHLQQLSHTSTPISKK